MIRSCDITLFFVVFGTLGIILLYFVIGRPIFTSVKVPMYIGTHSTRLPSFPTLDSIQWAVPNLP